ncbi:MAG: cytochrome C oxidase subunit IV family protein [Novosphingobium sp.]|nr:cytochrome C oxidase subunit IV family protein [Novosphingobium sp.]
MSGRLSSTGAMLLLVMLTLGAFVAFEFEGASLVAGLSIFVIALAKVQLIIEQFMHLRWSHRPFRQVLYFWSTIVLAVLCGGLFLIPWS